MYDNKGRRISDEKLIRLKELLYPSGKNFRLKVCGNQANSKKTHKKDFLKSTRSCNVITHP